MMISYEEAVRVLRDLKSSAESVDRNEDSVFADYRGVANHDLREIVETLLRLDLNGLILAPGESMEGPLIGTLRMLQDSAEFFDAHEDDCIEDYRYQAQSEKRYILNSLLGLELDGNCLEAGRDVKGKTVEAGEANKKEEYVLMDGSFNECIANCEWIIDHAQELKALLRYNSVEMLRNNGVRATCAVDTMMAALKDVGAFIDEVVSPAKSLGAVLENAASRAGKSERNLSDKDLEIC